MPNFSLLILLITVTTIFAAPQYVPQRAIYVAEPANPYDYNYKIDNPSSNTLYGKNEAGDGLGKVTGSFFVLLPDNRIMTVDYFVDGDSGFVPKISFSSGLRG